jgi:large conductance mechanosensitive channel
VTPFRHEEAKGNMIDMAVGIIVGAAFTTVVSLWSTISPRSACSSATSTSRTDSLLRDGTPEPPYVSVDQAKRPARPCVSYRQFINAYVSFLIVAFVLFLVVRWVTKLRKPAPVEPTTRSYPYCQSTIAIAATRYPQCASQRETKTVTAT